MVLEKLLKKIITLSWNVLHLPLVSYKLRRRKRREREEMKILHVRTDKDTMIFRCLLDELNVNLGKSLWKLVYWVYAWYGSLYDRSGAT